MTLSGVLISGLIACSGVSHGALHIIQGSGTTSDPGEPGMTGIMLGSTFTFQMVFDDAVSSEVISQSSRNIVIYENPVISFKMDGVEQMDKFDGMATAGFSSQIIYADRLAPSERDIFHVEMADANIRIEGLIAIGYLNGGPYNLNLLDNLLETQMSTIFSSYSVGRDIDVAYGNIDQRTAPQLFLVPEPSSITLLGLGVIGISLRRKRQ